MPEPVPGPAEPATTSEPTTPGLEPPAATLEPAAATITTTPPMPRRGRRVGPFSLRQVGLAVAAVTITALVLVGITTPLGSADPGVEDPRQTAFVIASPTAGLAAGQVPPGFEVTGADGSTVRLLDLDGNPVSLDDLRGRAVWVNFFATWCPPCQVETPTLREIDALYRDRGLSIVAVDVQETVESGRRHADTYGLGYTIGADVGGDVFRAWHVFALPTQFFIAPDGTIRAVSAGPLTTEQASELVEAILPEAGGTAAPSPSPSPG